MKRHYKERIVSSRLTLPWTSVMVAIVWLAAYLCHSQILMIVAVAFVAIITMLTAFLNTRNVLMRSYSRMPSTVFLVLSCAAMPYLIEKEGVLGLFVTSMLLIFYLHMFMIYQEKNAPDIVARAFTFIGIASLLCPKMTGLALLLWITASIKMMILSLKNTIAAIIGFLLPFWLGVGFAVLHDKDLGYFIEWLHQLLFIAPQSDFSGWTLIQKVTVGFVGILYAIGSLHFLNVSSKDSIKTRMCYHVFIIIGGFAALLICFQPQAVNWLLPILIANTAYLFGHFATYSQSRFSAILFLLATVSAITLTAYHLWMIS